MQNTDCLNVRGQRVSTEEVLAAIDRLHSRYVLITDNVGMANRIARERPEVQVIYREFYPVGISGQEDGDDNLHLKIRPATWIGHMNGLGIDAGIWWYCGNEPAREWATLAAWLKEAMCLADTLGRRLIVGNFSVGVPEPEDWLGPLLPLLEALGNGRHTLGVHEYMVASFEGSTYHLVGRFLKAWDTAAAKGYSRPHTLITEADFDLKGAWPIQCQGDARRFAIEFQKAARFYYMHGIDGVFHFSFGPWYRGEPGQSNYTGDFDIRPALGELEQRTTPVPSIVKPDQPEEKPQMPEPIWIPATAKPKGSYTVNIRSAASASAADVGDLVAEDAVEFFPVQGDWWMVRKSQTTGWAHVGYVDFIPNLTPQNGEGQGDEQDQARIVELEQQIETLTSENAMLKTEAETNSHEASMGRRFAALVNLVMGGEQAEETSDIPF